MALSIRVPRIVIPALLMASALPAQDAPVLELSLEEALVRAEATSEPLVIAEAGILRARGEEYRARSEYFPQVSGSLTYTRTFRSEFSGLAGGGGGDGVDAPPAAEPCGPYLPDPTLPLVERVDSLERAVACLTAGGPGTIPDLSELFGGGRIPFGNPNRYDLGVSASIPIYTGGRRVARTRIAEAGRRSAEAEVRAQRAQVAFEVTRAYFDALLAARLLGIAELALEQAERTLAVTLVAVEAGDQAEFDALRARVARDNQRAEVVRRAATRDVAFNRLRTLVGLPLDQPLVLTTELGDEVPAAVRRRAPDPAGPDTTAALRSTVVQAGEAVRIQEGLLEIARSQRLPQIVMTGQVGQVALPEQFLPRRGDFRTTASLTIGAEVPIFTGGRIRGDELVAEADVVEAAARYAQLLDLAAEDAAAAIRELDAAQATFEAAGATIQEAERAYAIAELRYAEGVASLLELTETRLLLEEALANRAVAARDLQVAQTRLALLPDLPLQAPAIGSTTSAVTSSVAQSAAAGARSTPSTTTSTTRSGAAATVGTRATTRAGGAANAAGATGPPGFR